MGMVVNFNAAAVNAQRNLGVTSKGLNQSIQRLSSGLRVNGASDDPAGLVISEQMRSKADGLGQAIRNSNDGINLIKTAERAMGQMADLLRQMRTLAVHAANTGVNSTDDLDADQDSIVKAMGGMNTIVVNTRFNGKPLLYGTFTNQNLQIGEESSDTLQVSIDNVGMASLFVVFPDLNTGNAAGAITDIDTAIAKLSTARAKLGATQKYTLETTVNSLSVSEENIRSSESAIRDADMSKEMVEFTRNNIMMQAGTAMLAQANQSNQSVLSLIRG